VNDSNRLVPESEILPWSDGAVHRMRIGSADKRHRRLDDRIGRAGFRNGFFHESDTVDRVHHEGLH